MIWFSAPVKNVGLIAIGVAAVLVASGIRFQPVIAALYTGGNHPEGILHFGGTDVAERPLQAVNIALQIASRGYVLQTGAVVLSGTAAELLSNDMVRKAYLGET
jgi:hypothetical protein